MKKTRITPSVPVTHGIRSRFFVRFATTAIVVNTARISAQNNNEPDWPAQNALKRYTFGRFELV